VVCVVCVVDVVGVVGVVDALASMVAQVPGERPRAAATACTRGAHPSRDPASPSRVAAHESRDGHDQSTAWNAAAIVSCSARGINARVADMRQCATAARTSPSTRSAVAAVNP